MPGRNDSPLNGVIARGLAVLTTVAVSGCAQVGPAYYGAGESPLSCAEARGYNQVGTASWYGHAHHGRRTASGAPFNMNGMTAAHRTLPFGSKIRVTNRGNGRSVLLTVNDRGPFIRGRIVDVSYRAAKELKFARAGLARVRVEAIASC